jgi:hypothetical protein
MGSGPWPGTRRRPSRPMQPSTRDGLVGPTSSCDPPARPVSAWRRRPACGGCLLEMAFQVAAVYWIWLRGRGEDSKHEGGTPVHQILPEVADVERWRTRDGQRWRTVEGEGEKLQHVSRELNGTSSQIEVDEGEEEESWSMLPTAAWWWWRTVVRGEAPPVTGFEGEGVIRLRHTVELLWEAEGDEELTADGEFDGEGVGRYCS